MERVICLAIGYVFGMFQTAFFYGKAHGIDIRNYGSGNSGTTNALRVLGRKAGLIVFLGDIIKTILAVCIVRLLFGGDGDAAFYLYALYAAAGAILGHNFPFYMKFKGGKGIAATGGLVIAFHPWFFAVAVILFFATFFITHYVSLGSLILYAGFMIQLVVFGQNGWFGDVPQNVLYEMYAIGAFLTVMAYVRHRANIVRLVKGNERKTYLSKKNRKEES